MKVALLLCLKPVMSARLFSAVMLSMIEPTMYRIFVTDSQHVHILNSDGTLHSFKVPAKKKIRWWLVAALAVAVIAPAVALFS